VFGLSVVALAAGRVIGSGIESIEVLNEPARATFVVEQAAMYLLITVAAAVGGALISGVGYAIGRLAAPDDERFPLGPLTVVGAATGAIVGFATARAAIGVGGTIVDGMVSLSVFRAAIVAAIAGAVVGIVLGATVDRLLRPRVIGLEGSAWPSTTREFLRDAVAAMGLPALALVVALGLVFGLSRVLLDADHLVAVIIFGAAAALVLFGATAIAALPGRHSAQEDARSES
jgi:hypothetical protein